MKTRSLFSFAVVLGCAVGLKAEVGTFVSPMAQDYDDFGASVAAVGADRVIIGDPRANSGAENAGAAYLFNFDGDLVTTYTNPTSAADDNFGYAVAGVGENRVLISARSDDMSGYNDGVAYLYDVAGQLITTYTNPFPWGTAASYFGNSVAAVGANRVLIGANSDKAFLYDLEGNQMATCYNPTPETYDGFGTVVASVATDRLLVTANNDSSILTGMGMAYLFDLSATLITTYTNPTPAEFDSFGISATAVGSGYVLIGAYRDDAGADNAGAAHLFDLFGNLITTYTNPAPVVESRFGTAVAAVGSERVVIATGEWSGVSNTAYLYDLSGNLIAALVNPATTEANGFGCAVAAVGTDWVLVGAKQSSAAALYAGAAYLFPLVPELAMDSSQPGHVTLSWPPMTPGWVLQETLSLSPTNWVNSASGTNSPVLIPATAPAKFYRLNKP